VAWDFLQRYDESWIWRCASGYQVTESKRNFAALDECIADAVRNGYDATPRSKRDQVQAAAGTRSLRPESP
jgi:hypothetical protein